MGTIKAALTWLWSVVLTSLGIGLMLSAAFFGSILLAFLAGILAILAVGAVTVVLIREFLVSDPPVKR